MYSTFLNHSILTAIFAHPTRPVVKVSRYLSKGVRRLSRIQERLSYKFHVPPGHFYSPIVSEAFVRQYEDAIFAIKRKEIEGVDLHEEEQLALLEKLSAFYSEMPFTAGKQVNLRYYYDNEYYSYSDAIFLHSMIRHLQPKKIIEVGSGFSSAMMLDTNQLFFDQQIDLTFIEPYSERLRSILQEDERIRLLEKNIQDVPPEFFRALGENDVLFVDTSHVVKTGSDVNYILFNIIPHLRKGVYIHFHDVFFPFEYPKEWVLDMKRCWSEDYLLRAFLMYNTTFAIRLFSTFLLRYHADWFRQHMPLCLHNAGACLWLQKTEETVFDQTT